MLSLDLSTLSTAAVQNYLQHAIAPRPICFASTVNSTGEVNLSPYSFFNLFSSNPPIAIFSPSLRVRDNASKHTLQNVLEVPEVVINMVDYDMVQQMSLSSVEYPQGVNEFDKAGFTMQKATLLKPPMVKESKIKLECVVEQVVPLGTQGGAGNLVICKILMMHIDDAILTDAKYIDQTKIDLVARLGASWYCHTKDALFQVPKPNTELSIGFDALPNYIKNHTNLTGNELAKLASVTTIPNIQYENLPEAIKNLEVQQLQNAKIFNEAAITLIKQFLAIDDVSNAWQVVLRMVTS